MANVRVHGTRGVTPLSRLGQEPLPPLPGTRQITHRRATRACTVPYRGNVYSVPALHAGQMLLLKETEDGWLRIYTAEHRLVKGRFQRVGLDAPSAGLPQTQPGRPPALARPVIQPELAPAVEARPLSVYAQLLAVTHA